jgi:hypothetical protein
VTIEFSKDQPRAGAKKGSNGEIKPRQRERVTLAGPGPVLTRALTGATQAQPSPCILRPLKARGKRSKEPAGNSSKSVGPLADGWSRGSKAVHAAILPAPMRAGQARAVLVVKADDISHSRPACAKVLRFFHVRQRTAVIPAEP